jgi:hypothetical protein
MLSKSYLIYIEQLSEKGERRGEIRGESKEERESEREKIIIILLLL